MSFITNLVGRLVERKKVPKKTDARERARQFWREVDTLASLGSSETRTGAALGWTITLGISKCFEGALDYIKWEDSQPGWHRQWYIVESEFFCFFIHLTNRRFYSTHGETIGDRWQRELALGYTNEFIDRLFKASFTWPNGMTQEAKRSMEEHKARIHSELMHNINVTELDYSSCRELFAEYDGRRCSVGGLFGKLAQNLIKAACINDPLSQIAVENVVFSVFLTMGLWDRIDQAAKELIAHPIAA
jgi:hypothetical protein